MWRKPEVDTTVSVWHSPWDWKVINPKYFTHGIWTDIGSYTIINASQGVSLGDNVQIGPHCAILSISTIDGKQGEVIIKRNAKIGTHTTVMPGVTIGENSVVGAHSFVSTNIPDNEMWWGVPAQFRRTI